MENDIEHESIYHLTIEWITDVNLFETVIITCLRRNRLNSEAEAKKRCQGQLHSFTPLAGE